MQRMLSRGIDMNLSTLYEIVAKWEGAKGFHYICAECQEKMFIKLEQEDHYCACGKEVIIIDAVVAGLLEAEVERKEQAEKSMKISEVKKLVDSWNKNGLKTTCDSCQNELVVKPNDKIIVCKHCDSEYHAGTLIFKELPDWIHP